MDFRQIAVAAGLREHAQSGAAGGVDAATARQPSRDDRAAQGRHAVSARGGAVGNRDEPGAQSGSPRSCATSPSASRGRAASTAWPIPTRSPDCPTACCCATASSTRSPRHSAIARWSACCSSISISSRRSTIRYGHHVGRPAAARDRRAHARLRARDRHRLAPGRRRVRGGAAGAARARWMRRAVARKILGALAQAVSHRAHEVTITPTLGISIYPQDGMDAETLLRNADTAMYHAKESGRNRFEYLHTPGVSEARARQAHRLTCSARLSILAANPRSISTPPVSWVKH